MMNYQKMTDFEINCAVAGMIGDEVYSSKSERKHKAYRIGDRNRDVYESGWSTDVFDPCNSWADAGPIIEENRIDLITAKVGIDWIAHDFNCSISNVDKNPRRAAMIVFLMMKNGE